MNYLDLNGVWELRQQGTTEISEPAEPSTTTSVKNTNKTTKTTKTEPTAPAASEVDEQVDELKTLIKDMGADINSGKTMDFSDLDPSAELTSKFEKL